MSDPSSVPDDTLDGIIRGALQGAIAKRTATVIAREATAAFDAADPEWERQLSARARTRATEILDELKNEPDESEDEEEEPAPRELTYPHAVAFFRDKLRNVYRRRLGDTATSSLWVEDWWQYPEALEVMDALWRAWEFLSLDPTTGLSVWWKDHARPHMTSLMSPGSSPFPRVVVRDVNVTETDLLPHLEPPAGAFQDLRSAGTVATAIVRLLADHDLPDWAVLVRGYLPPELADDPDTVASLPTVPPLRGSAALGDIDDAAGTAESVEALLPVDDGYVHMTLQRQATDAPWLATTVTHLPDAPTDDEGEPR